MRTIVDNLDNKVHYFVHGSSERFEKIDDAKAEGKVEGIEFTYYCPYCDAPNTNVHTTPVPDGLIDTCHHCDRQNVITPPHKDRVEQHFAEDFSHHAKRLENKRLARLVGERDASSIGRANLAELVVYPAIGITISTALMLMVMAPIFGIIFLFNSSILGLVGGVATGLVMWQFIKRVGDPMDKVRDWVVGDTLPQTPNAIVDNANMIEHGVKVSNNKENLYVPPDSDIDKDTLEEKERELLLEK